MRDLECGAIWLPLANVRSRNSLFYFTKLKIFFVANSDIDCNALPPLEHGSILLSEKRTTYGVQATYTCHENYTLIGNENRTCQIDGWTGKQPQCLIDWCPDPPLVAGSTVQVNGKRAGSTAVYDCEKGFVLSGEPVSDVFLKLIFKRPLL